MIQDIPMPSQSPQELVTDKRPIFQGTRVEICCDTLATQSGSDYRDSFVGLKWVDFRDIIQYITIPIGSIYAIYGNIYHQYTPNGSIYTIHGSYGMG